jgi:hypothetical protein
MLQHRSRDNETRWCIFGKKYKIIEILYILL